MGFVCMYVSLHICADPARGSEPALCRAAHLEPSWLVPKSWDLTSGQGLGMLRAGIKDAKSK